MSYVAPTDALSTSQGIGVLLMDQSKVAGIGNIYRSEILYAVRARTYAGRRVHSHSESVTFPPQAGIHPEQPANTLSAEELLRVWDVTTEQMEKGFETGSIWDPVTGPKVANTPYRNLHRTLPCNPVQSGALRWLTPSRVCLWLAFPFGSGLSNPMAYCRCMGSPSRHVGVRYRPGQSGVGRCRNLHRTLPCSPVQ